MTTELEPLSDHSTQARESTRGTPPASVCLAVSCNVRNLSPMRISSASPPLHPVVPDRTPSAVAPHSTPTTATPEPQRARTDATGAEIKQGNPSQKTSLSGAALHKLPNELLLQIAGSTGPRGKGVNLSLRRVSQQMKVIADDQMSPNQRFLVQNGQNLHAAGYHAGSDMNTLAARPATEQQFVLNNAQRLQAVGYNGEKMNVLAAMPAAARDFVLTHAQQLRANGYNYAFQINRLAAQPDQREAFLRQIGHRS